MIDTLTLSTPVGKLCLLTNDTEGTVVAAGFAPLSNMWDRLTAMSGTQHLALGQTTSNSSAGEAINAYFDGDTTLLDQIKVRQPGTEFQQLVWDALRAIPAGQTRTYGQLAEAIGRPKAVRAVGSACGRNLVAPIVFCHRAIRSDGSMGGYYYGLEIKKSLLAHESEG